MAWSSHFWQTTLRRRLAPAFTISWATTATRSVGCCAIWAHAAGSTTTLPMPRSLRGSLRIFSCTEGRENRWRPCCAPCPLQRKCGSMLFWAIAWWRRSFAVSKRLAALLLALTALMLVLTACYRVLETPFWNYNGSRLMPSFAVARGINYYVLPHHGPL